ncbi:alpha/beta fold hydrolase [Paenibacillus sp. LHD-38]|uniref:alpha/beta hydrolase n=1 Tax=Paenibacillus sp. LHD-38 TaxID=3072143 RepID=UPI00281099FD|nr:alpha/beta fold hydrolase [Paenibacillus sp. LHD-38]MDQ8732947.1 alpha/beta fold hydrolase [Paenibacillus sp. LHD-38]
MMAAAAQLKNQQQEAVGTILWLTGWSMPETVFDRLREQLPDFHHIFADYKEADSLEKMLMLTETAVENFRSSRALNCNTRGYGPLLIGGWSLGGLLALKLAAKGCVDGLVLFAATARFTRSKEETDLGWPDVFVRQMIKGLMNDRQCVEMKFRRNMFTGAEWESGLGNSLPGNGSWTASALIAGLQLLRSEECLSQLPEIKCPVLLVHGTADQICPFGAASELAERVPQAELLAIPGGGHVPFLGRETDMAEKLRRWWDEQQNSGY